MLVNSVVFMDSFSPACQHLGKTAYLFFCALGCVLWMSWMERKLTVLQSVDLFPVAGLKRVLFVLAIGEGHDSSIHFVTDVGPTPSARSLSLRHLPLRDVGQLSLQTGNVVVKVFELWTLNLEIVTIFLITSRDL
jgi:hypothetical protein